MSHHDDDFVPPHCPNPSCRHHADPLGWRWHRNGRFLRKAAPQRIRRFRCVACQRHFSSQTFQTTYFLKRPDIQVPLVEALVNCTALRQFARSQRIAPSTAQRQASRLGRHALLYEASFPRPVLDEDVVLDGFVSFEHSQFRPFEILLLVGACSQFIYGFAEAEVRRSGRMRPDQKRRRAQLERLQGKADPRAVEKAVTDLMTRALPDRPKVTIRSDLHRTYERVLARIPRAIEHVRVSSRRSRRRGNALFAVDLLDLLIRHSLADHKRETIAFAKRRQGALERFAVFMLWRNHVKRTSENRKSSLTPAQAAGVRRGRGSREQLLARRYFPSLVALPASLALIYERRVPTRALARTTRHELRLAA